MKRKEKRYTDIVKWEHDLDLIHGTASWRELLAHLRCAPLASDVVLLLVAVLAGRALGNDREVKINQVIRTAEAVPGWCEQVHGNPGAI